MNASAGRIAAAGKEAAAGPGPPVLLFSTPWMKAGWPSLAIGSLKGYLNAHGLDAHCCHLHLEAAAALGWGTYDALSETWGAGDALFGALLDPADGDRLAAVAARLLREENRPEAAAWAEGAARDELRDFVEAWLDREQPELYPIVGGSIGALQLCGTLYLLKRISERGHAGRRLLGGAGLVGSAAGELLRRFPYIDLVIEGEGEEALLQLASQAVDAAVCSGEPPGTLQRSLDGEPSASAPPAPLDLSQSPPAALDEFYASARSLGIPATALTISFEHSRGCAWEHRTRGRLRGCTFCGLYRNSPNHRQKPVDNIIDEIEQAVDRYRVLNLGFVDAYLPADYRDELLDRLNRLPADVRFFTEMRCDLTRSTAALLAKRASRIQLGVESFSTAILRHIGKGVSGAQAAYSLRLCQEYGVPTQYNLMGRIPGVKRADIDALHDLMPTLFGLLPPSPTSFYLDRNSLVYADPEAHGVAPESLDAARPPWLAACLGDSRISQMVPFEPVDRGAESAWLGIEAQVERWHQSWRTARSVGLASPLCWRDGGSWASVTDAREGMAKIYLLDGPLYGVFRACDEVASLQKVAEMLPELDVGVIERSLEELTAHRLLFQDGPRFVSVAVREQPRPS